MKPGLLQFFRSAWQLEDLEGLAIDGSDFVYAITSFSRTDEGRENKNREKLSRFRIDGDRLVDGRVARGLKRALTGRHPAFARAAGVRDVKNGGGLNIEALVASRSGHSVHACHSITASARSSRDCGSGESECLRCLQS